MSGLAFYKCKFGIKQATMSNGVTELFPQFAAELGCKFMEVSAKSGHSVNLVCEVMQ